MTRRRSLAVVAIAALGTVALAAGIAQGSSGDDGDTQVATIDAAVEAADVRLCPGAAPVGQLDPGDTVALTGRSEDGAWLQLRSPTDEDERVWIDAALVVVTTTPEDLPILRCGAVDLAIELIGGAELVLTPKTTTTTTTTTTITGAASTTTTGGGDTTTSDPGDTTEPADPTTTAAPRPGRPPATTPTTTRPRTTTTRPTTTTTTTTAPPDLSPPTVERFTASVATINESGGGGCQQPNQVQLRATVIDRSGISNVRLLYWISANGVVYVRGNVAMPSIGDDRFQATIGPVGQVLPPGVHGQITWQVHAFDAAPARNTILATAPPEAVVALRNC